MRGKCHKFVTAPLSASAQNKKFNDLVKEALDDDFSYEAVQNIQDKLYELREDENLILDNQKIKTLLAASGLNGEKLQVVERRFDVSRDNKVEFLASNLGNAKKYEVKTPEITVQVPAERTDLVETKLVNGRKCLVIALGGSVEINGIPVH